MFTMLSCLGVYFCRTGILHSHQFHSYSQTNSHLIFHFHSFALILFLFLSSSLPLFLSSSLPSTLCLSPFPSFSLSPALFASYLAAACAEYALFPIKVFECTTGALVFAFAGHHNLVYDLVWSADSRLLLTASSDQRACVWNFEERATGTSCAGRRGIGRACDIHLAS